LVLPWETWRNIDELERSRLIGRRYQLEKKAEGAPSGSQNAAKHQSENPPVVSESTIKRLAEDYGVSRDTILEDGTFVEGLDALKEVREDLPTSVMTPVRLAQDQRSLAGP
jgi:hypothetical protein